MPISPSEIKKNKDEKEQLLRLKFDTILAMFMVGGERTLTDDTLTRILSNLALGNNGSPQQPAPNAADEEIEFHYYLE